MKKLFKQKPRNQVGYRYSNNYIGTVTVTPKNLKRLSEFRQAVREIGRSTSIRGRSANRRALAERHGLIYNMVLSDVPAKFATSLDVYWR